MDDALRLFVVDEDEGWLKSTSQTLQAAGFHVHGFRTIDQFLADVSGDIGGIMIADLHLPGKGIDQQQQRILDSHPMISLVSVLSSPDVASAVCAMENGAVTVLQKPYTPEELKQAVEKAIHRAATLGKRDPQIWRRFHTLNDDERRVMHCMVRGIPNKRVVAQLNMSSRTLDRRRAAVMSKMEVESIPELAKLWEQAAGFGME